MSLDELLASYILLVVIQPHLISPLDIDDIGYEVNLKVISYRIRSI